MSDVRYALEDLAERAEAQARPPALAVLRRRRTRRAAARGAGAGLVLVAVASVAVGLLGPGTDRRPDVVVAEAPPSTAPSPASTPAVPVPPGKVAVPPAAQAGVLLFPAGSPPVADLLSRHPTADGPLVTAGQRRGDDACTTVFVDGTADGQGGGQGGGQGSGQGGGQGGGATCTPVDGPRYRTAGRLDLLAASSGPTGGPVSSLVLHGSAPAGTRTLVLTGSEGAATRIPVASAGAQYGERAYFAVPWVEQDTVVQALDADGRVLTTGELLIAMGEGAPAG